MKIFQYFQDISLRRGNAKSKEIKWGKKIKNFNKFYSSSKNNYYFFKKIIEAIELPFAVIDLIKKEIVFCNHFFCNQIHEEEFCKKCYLAIDIKKDLPFKLQDVTLPHLPTHSFDITATPMSISETLPECALLMFFETTCRKKAEESLIEANKKIEKYFQEIDILLKKLERLKTIRNDLFNNITHEFRTPLNGVLGFCSLLESTDLDQYQKDFLSYIKSSGKRLLDLSNNLIDFSSLKKGDIEMVHTSFDVETLLKNTIKECEENKPEGISISYFISSKAPRNFHGDYNNIFKILCHLINNSYKFIKSGSVVLNADLSLFKHENFKTIFAISVKDTGIGIPPDKVLHIFEPFVQSESSFTRRYQGVGVTLSYCKSLALLMGGDLILKSSEVGLGSEFCLILPGEQEKDCFRQIINNSKSPLNYNGKVLVVEDDHTSQLVATLFLKKLGFEVDLASGGRSCLELMKSNEYSLIFLDLQMPEINGFETAKLIREYEILKNKRVPIIALTALYAIDVEDECIKCGMDDFLFKPISFEKIEFICQKWFKKATSN